MRKKENCNARARIKINKKLLLVLQVAASEVSLAQNVVYAAKIHTSLQHQDIL